jgi:tRNA pseudouridine55 synthase
VTGCLPVLLGDATRLAQVFLEGVKEYVAVLELHGPVPTDLDSVVAEFEGPLYQKPPRKSAVTRRLRVREVYGLDVLGTDDRQVLLRIRCESGTYVRKLCHDLGLALGTGGHMGHLRRTETSPFDDRSLVTLHDLADALAVAEGGEDGYEADEGRCEPADEPFRAVVSPAERALVHLPRVTIAPSAAEQVATGAPVYAPGVIDVAPATEPVPENGTGVEVADGDLLACYTPDGSAVCLGRLVGDPDAEQGEVVSLERVLV